LKKTKKPKKPKKETNTRLVAVGKPTHAAHDAEHVVVDGIDVDVGNLLGRDKVVTRGVLVKTVHIRHKRGRRERQVQDSVVNAAEVAGARGLELLGLEGERVDIHTLGRRVGVVLVGLDIVEVAALALRETVLAVELNLRHRRGVVELRVRVPPRGVGLRVAVQVAGVLDNPHELLAGVVERQLDLVGGGGDRLRARELQLLNQVLVGDLGEPAALLRVQVDVVNIQRAGRETRVVQRADGRRRRRRRRARDVDQVLDLVELHVDLHLVVLQRNQRERQAGVAIEPELQRDVQGLLRNAVVQGIALAKPVDTGVRAQRAVRAEVRERGVEAREGDRILRRQLRVAAVARLIRLESRTAIAVHHVEVRQLLAGRERELIPDVEPLAVVLVNLLAADLNVHVVNQVLAQVGDPRQSANRLGNHRAVNRRQSHLHVHAGDQVAVARDRALHTLAEVADTVEGLLNGLHREVGVAAVELLEEGNLGVRRQVYVLGAIGDELHEATRSHCLYSTDLNFFGRSGQIRGFSWSRPIRPFLP